ncbi:hypothetical protein IFR05_001632 [Cadophora sp. M221]|nr:hypothetical protein IFR05_001632 [Cadophora sp. M221]
MEAYIYDTSGMNEHLYLSAERSRDLDVGEQKDQQQRMKALESLQVFEKCFAGDGDLGKGEGGEVKMDGGDLEWKGKKKVYVANAETYWVYGWLCV